MFDNFNFDYDQWLEDNCYMNIEQKKEEIKLPITFGSKKMLLTQNEIITFTRTLNPR